MNVRHAETPSEMHLPLVAYGAGIDRINDEELACDRLDASSNNPVLAKDLTGKGTPKYLAASAGK